MDNFGSGSIKEYNFNEQLKMSQGVSTSKDVKDIILENIPGALSVMQAHSKNDRNGNDWWVECEKGKFLSFDCKVRSEDWATKVEPQKADDLALETFSVVEKNIVGWTRDKSKQTDYILWLWTDTGRWCMVPFKMLCSVYQDKWQEWKALYKTSKQFTPERNYHSECTFVPRREVWKEIYLKYGGNEQKSPITGPRG